MSIKKFITLGKLLALLLLIGYAVAANASVTTNEFQGQRKVSFGKTEHSFHGNMLQPQVVQVSITPKHSVTTSQQSYAALFYSENISLLLQPTGQKQLTLQDVNRCESVSRLLFPFHFFW